MQHTVRIFGPNFAFGLIYLVLRDPQSSTSSQCPTSSNHKFTSPDMIIIQVIYVIFIWYLYDIHMICILYVLHISIRQTRLVCIDLDGSLIIFRLQLKIHLKHLRHLVQNATEFPHIKLKIYGKSLCWKIEDQWKIQCAGKKSKIYGAYGHDI